MRDWPRRLQIFSPDLARSRDLARKAAYDFDGHEWAQFIQWVGHVNMRLHREREEIELERGTTQNFTERMVPVWRDHGGYERPGLISWPDGEAVADEAA